MKSRQQENKHFFVCNKNTKKNNGFILFTFVLHQKK